MQRILTVIAFGALILGCGRTSEQPASEAATPAVNPLAAYAGQWTLRALPMEGDDVLTEFGMTATENATGWSIKFSHLDEPVPVTSVRADGDSVRISFGPYWSALRDQVMVSVESAMMADGGQISGGFVANYTNSDPPTLKGRISGSRAN